MKRMLIAAVTLSAIAGAAVAQPAWHARAGGPPQEYPPCSHPHQDRCVQHGMGGWHGGGGHHDGDEGHHWRHHHDDGDEGHHWRHHHHSSTDGERG